MAWSRPGSAADGSGILDLLPKRNMRQVYARTDELTPAALEAATIGPMSATEPDRSDEVRLAEIVMPNRTNHLGTLFGGHALGLMDHAGWGAATRFAHRTMVTVAMDRVEFKVPVHAGQLVELVARVTHAGHTSVTVGVDMYAEEIATGDAARHLGDLRVRRDR